MEILLAKAGNGLIAGADDRARDVVRRWGRGEVRKCSVTAARNIKFHRYWFALLHEVYANQNQFDDFESFRAYVTVLAGHSMDYVHESTGEFIQIPKSISFAAMDEDEFAVFFRKACDVMIEKFLPGVKYRHLRDELERAVGRAW